MTTYTDRQKACTQCGMPCEPNEYHPYAACLMFQACGSSAEVRAHLSFIRASAPDAASVTAFSEPAGAGDVRGERQQDYEIGYQQADDPAQGSPDLNERALLAAGQWANADTPVAVALAYRDGFVAGAAPSQPAAPAEQSPLMTWQDGVGLLWDVHGHGKWIKRVVSPLKWDAHAVYLDMQGARYAPHIDIRLVSSANNSSVDAPAVDVAVAQGEPVAWQVRRTDGRIDGVPILWESCTKQLYDATLATGRYAGYENGPRCEVRALFAAPLPRASNAPAAPKSMRCPRGGGSCSVDACLEESACTLSRVCDAPVAAVPVPADCDVRKILLKVVPGDGDGYEVYAKNVSDVEQLLSDMGERLETFELARAVPAATAPAALTDEQIIRAGYMHTVADDEPLFAFDRQEFLAVVRELLATNPSNSADGEAHPDEFGIDECIESLIDAKTLGEKLIARNQLDLAISRKTAAAKPVGVAAFKSIPAPLSEYREDFGSVVWWAWQDDIGMWLGEPAWIGVPTDSDWPGYHTHWTFHPEFPTPPTESTGEPK